MYSMENNKQVRNFIVIVLLYVDDFVAIVAYYFILINFHVLRLILMKFVSNDQRSCTRSIQQSITQFLLL